jgi:hypothetical protein
VRETVISPGPTNGEHSRVIILPVVYPLGEQLPAILRDRSCDLRSGGNTAFGEGALNLFLRHAEQAAETVAELFDEGGQPFLAETRDLRKRKETNLVGDLFAAREHFLLYPVE